MLLNRRFPLPHFEGPIGYSTWLRSVYQFCTQQLVPLHLSVTSLDLNKRLTLRLVLSNDVLVIMGRDDWQHRFARFVALYAKVQRDQNKMIKQVDLRYPNGVARDVLVRPINNSSWERRCLNCSGLFDTF